METKTITYKAKLVALDIDCLGYTNYVFENLNSTDLENQYIMCVRFPNWEQKVFNIERNKEFTYHIVGSYETDPLNGKISDSSPIGIALLGARAGDEVIVEGVREQHLQIKSVSRAKE